MDSQLSQGLTFLAWTSTSFLIVVGIFFVKLLFDCSKLLKNIDKNVVIVQNELEPIVKNISETTTTINNIVQTANGKISKFSNIYDKATDVVVNTVSKASAVSGTLLKYAFKGLCSSFKYFTKK